MSAANTDSVRQVTPGMRAMLYAASFLVFSVGIPLFLLTEQTDVYFSWTIKSALTAAFLGAAYWSSFVLELLAAREREWSRARIAVAAVLAFTALTLVVTLIHREKFNFSAPAFITVAGTWVWLAVYAVVPPLMLALLLRQRGAPGGDGPRTRPLPVWVRAAYGANAAVMLVLGVVLFVAPLAGAVVWPWTLTTLTGQAIGAWLIGLGIAAGQAAWENDQGRSWVMSASAVVFCLLQLVAVARYPAELFWDGPSAWVYLAFLLELLAASAYAVYMGRQMAQPVAATA